MRTITEIYLNNKNNLSCISCSSQLVKQMGGNDREAIFAAGLAGGIGFSGNTCGALGAAIWYNTLKWCRENPEADPTKNPDIPSILDKFYKATHNETLCCKISGQWFKTIDEHTDFVENGGCSRIIEALASG